MNNLDNVNIRNNVNILKDKLRKILHFSGESRNVDYYISSLTEVNPFKSTEEIDSWLSGLNRVQLFNVEKIPLSELRSWAFDDWTGDLNHVSGGFFSIRGLKTKTNIGHVKEWTQPIIYQPEIGVLGIIAKKINGIMYFLMQAKAEPGNLNTYQLSPTVQATRSNYLCLHGGKKTLYLEYFLDRKKAVVLFDQLQSEQGARFYQKRNRNIIVQIPEDQEIELYDNFRWLTLGQIIKLMQKDNCINMDTRSILSGISFSPERVDNSQKVSEENLYDCLNHSDIPTKPISRYGVKVAISGHSNSKFLNSIDTIIQKITDEKFKCEMKSHLIPLNNVSEWKRDQFKIYHNENKYFSVLGLRVEAEGREVISWDQPIIQQQDEGVVGFISREIDGVLHFLIQLKMECGVMDLLEMSPTVQCITGNYADHLKPLYIEKMVKNIQEETILDVFQSEEGGRFYKESNRNILILTDESIPIEQPSNYIWLSMFQIKEFIKFNNFLNVEARSLISAIKWG